MNFILLVLISIVVFLAIDMVWLVKIAPQLYKKLIGHLMAPKFKGLPALLFYVVFMIGFVFFVINPALIAESWTTALLNAALFGLVTYGTYDLTNWATLKEWPYQIVIIDMAWGTFLSSVSAMVVFFIGTWLGL